MRGMPAPWITPSCTISLKIACFSAVSMRRSGITPPETTSAPWHTMQVDAYLYLPLVIWASVASIAGGSGIDAFFSATRGIADLPPSLKAST